MPPAQRLKLTGRKPPFLKIFAVSVVLITAGYMSAEVEGSKMAFP